MADHNELVKEMIENEKLSSQKRLELAKKRRQHQLKKYHENEKKIEKQEKAANKRRTKTNSLLNPTSPKIISKVPRVIKVSFDRGIKLLEAAVRNDVNEVRELLEMGVSPDVANEDGLTALHQCCIDDNEEMLEVLLMHGANVNARDSEMWTPLHAASTCGHIDICRHLVERDADLLAVNADGNMPYDICEDEGTLEYLETQMADQGVTQELIDETRLVTEKKMLDDIKEYEREGNSLSIWRDRVGASLLHISAANGFYDVTAYLLTKRINMNAVDNDGWTPAMAAAFWAQLTVLDLLAKSGADFDVKTKDNKTLLDIVEDAELKEQIEEIKKEAENNMQKFRRVNSDIRRKSSNNIRSLNPGVSSMYSSNTSLSDKNPFSSSSRTPDQSGFRSPPQPPNDDSSVRRHSMRDKHKMSLQEAREEAKFRISISTEDMSDEPSSPRSTQDLSMPVTNIDDIDVTVSDNNVTTINITSPQSGVDNSQPLQQNTDTSIERAESNNPPTEQITSPVNGLTSNQESNKRVSATIQLNGGDEDGVEMCKPHNSKVTGDSVNGDSVNPAGNHIIPNTKPVAQISPQPSKPHPPDSSTDSMAGNLNKTVTDSSSLPAGDPPLKKYSAVHEPAIGEEKKKRCCVIC